MKNLVLIIVLSFIGTVGFGQNLSNYFKQLGKSDLSSVSAKFSDDMEVCIYDTQEFMTKAEAVKAISDFLANSGPISGSELHQGNSKKKTTQYRVGQLKTSKGNFRVFIYMEGDASNYEIVGININPE